MLSSKKICIFYGIKILRLQDSIFWAPNYIYAKFKISNKDLSLIDGHENVFLSFLFATKHLSFGCWFNKQRLVTNMNKEMARLEGLHAQEAKLWQEIKMQYEALARER